MTTTPVPIRSRNSIVKLETNPNVDLSFPSREKKMFSMIETFEVDLGPVLDEQGNFVLDSSGTKTLKDRQVEGYAYPTEHTPKINPNFVFSKEQTIAVLLGMTSRDSILLVGATGSGKTSLLEQIGARLNYSVIKISFDSAVSRNDLLGEWVVKGHEMSFQYGIVPLAFRMPGTILILDEWDAQNAETAFVLQRPLQKEDRSIFLLETREKIQMHKDNLICATANTNGQGDDTGLYSQGTRMQSYAQLNRFATTVKVEYPPAEVETKILYNIYKDELNTAEIKTFIVAVNKVRDGFANGQISVPLSTRDLINWADKYIKLADIMNAANYSFLNRMSIEDATVARGIIQRVAGSGEK
jgi:cobaltochelatase CobS